MKKTIYRIEDIAEVKSGKRIPKGMSFVNYKTDYKYIRARDIKNGAIHSDELVYIDDEVKKKIDKYIIEENDIAITIVGENIGDVGICPREISGSNLTENACRLTCYKLDKVFPKYLLCYLNQKHMKEHMQLLGSGAAQGKLGNYKTKRMKIELPNLNVQRKIAEEAEKYDCLIENNNKRIKILEQMTEELYKEWFVKMRFPDSQKYNFKSENPKGWILGNHNEMLIPEDWKFGKVADIGLFVRGKNITKGEMIEGEIPVISAGIQPSGYHNESNVKGYSLTMSASGANAGYLNYHLNDIWAADCSYYNNDSNIWFMYNSLNFIRKAIDNLQVGSAQPHVYPKNINKLSILIPEEKYILKFNELVKPFYEEIKVLKSKNDNLAKQRDLLLPRLMSGKLEVKESE